MADVFSEVFNTTAAKFIMYFMLMPKSSVDYVHGYFG